MAHSPYPALVMDARTASLCLIASTDFFFFLVEALSVVAGFEFVVDDDSQSSCIADSLVAFHFSSFRLIVFLALFLLSSLSFSAVLKEEGYSTRNE